MGVKQAEELSIKLLIRQSNLISQNKGIYVRSINARVHLYFIRNRSSAHVLLEDCFSEGEK